MNSHKNHKKLNKRIVYINIHNINNRILGKTIEENERKLNLNNKTTKPKL